MLFYFVQEEPLSFYANLLLYGDDEVFGIMMIVLSLFEKPIFTQERSSFESPRLVCQPVFSLNKTALRKIQALF